MPILIELNFQNPSRLIHQLTNDKTHHQEINTETLKLTRRRGRVFALRAGGDVHLRDALQSRVKAAVSLVQGGGPRYPWHYRYGRKRDAHRPEIQAEVPLVCAELAACEGWCPPGRAPMHGRHMVLHASRDHHFTYVCHLTLTSGVTSSQRGAIQTDRLHSRDSSLRQVAKESNILLQDTFYIFLHVWIVGTDQGGEVELSSELCHCILELIYNVLIEERNVSASQFSWKSKWLVLQKWVSSHQGDNFLTKSTSAPAPQVGQLYKRQLSLSLCLEIHNM